MKNKYRQPLLPQSNFKCKFNCVYQSRKIDKYTFLFKKSESSMQSAFCGRDPLNDPFVYIGVDSMGMQTVFPQCVSENDVSGPQVVGNPCDRPHSCTSSYVCIQQVLNHRVQPALCLRPHSPAPPAIPRKRMLVWMVFTICNNELNIPKTNPYTF